MNEWRPPKSDELEAMRRSGAILSRALAEVRAAVRPGVTAAELDEHAAAIIERLGGRASFKGYRGYPASLCVSRNDVVVHGIPTSAVVIANGDLVGLDLGVVYEGMHTDMATTVAVGTITPQAQRLLATTNASLQAALSVVRAGRRTGDIGAAVQAVVEAAGFEVVRDLVGHGVGRELHEDPSIPNFGQKGTGTKLRAGMTIALEPMVTAGDYRVVVDPDGWTVHTRDGSLAAHEERTVLVTRKGYELLTPLN